MSDRFAKEHSILLTCIIGALFGLAVLGALIWRSEQYQKNEIVIARIKRDMVLRPSINSMCVTYFKWSMLMKERVPNMESVCSRKVEP